MIMREVHNGDICLCAERLEGIDASNGWRHEWVACVAVDVEQGIAIPLSNLRNNDFGGCDCVVWREFRPITLANLNEAFEDNVANRKLVKRINDEAVSKQTQ